MRQVVEQAVLEEVRSILCGQGKTPEHLSPDDGLDADLGLSSADVVQLVSALTARLRVDPFEHSIAITDVRTVEDLCRLFSNLCSGSVGDRAVDTMPGHPPPPAVGGKA